MCGNFFLGKIPIIYIYICVCVCYSNLMDNGENHDQSWDGMRFQGLRQPQRADEGLTVPISCRYSGGRRQ